MTSRVTHQRRNVPGRQQLPNLFILGAARCGTSSLHVRLNQHPEITMSQPKEPHILAREDKRLNDYRRIFADAEGFKYRGESSVGYLLLSGVIPKLQEFMADSKFIVMVRNPVDRAWSHYWHIRGSFGAEKADFRQAFERSMTEPLVYTMHNKQYYLTGLYSRWLRHYLDAFSSEQVHLIVLEELNADPGPVLQDICDFLGVGHFDSPEMIHINQARIANRTFIFQTYAQLRRLIGRTILRPLPLSIYGHVAAGNRQVLQGLRRLQSWEEPPRITAADREWVADFYREEVRRFREMTGNSLDRWVDFPD
jgi:hypothetical protein